ncbi:sppk [Paucilactobacillus hokkaidonensis]|nr:sppk [Paucilactobacillus hokkaidonensis]
MVLILYRFIVGKYKVHYLIEDILISLLFGIVGLVLDDSYLILFLFMFLIKEAVENHSLKFNLEKAITMVSVLIVQEFIYFCAMYVSRLIVSFVFKPVNLNELGNHDVVLVLTTNVIDIITSFILIHLINDQKNKIDELFYKIENFNVRKQIFILILALFLSYQFIFGISNFQKVTAKIQLSIILTFTLFTALVIYQVILFLKTYTMRQENIDEKKRNAQLNEYLISVEQQYDELRKFKHDYKNMLLSLGSLVENDNKDQFKNYYQDLVNQDIVSTELKGGLIAQTDKIMNDPLRGLIIQKYFSAQNKSIQLELEVSDDQFKIDHDRIPIIRIIGILLDNAIEYTVDTDNKQITCAFVKTQNTIEISVENIVDEGFGLSRMNEFGYTTKGTNHGNGLTNIRNIIQQHDNLFFEKSLNKNKLVMTLLITEE